MATINITDLKSHPEALGYVYRENGDLSPWFNRRQITITGGAGWTPGTYTLLVAEIVTINGAKKQTWYLVGGPGQPAPLDTGGGQATVLDSDLTLTSVCGFASSPTPGHVDCVGPTYTLTGGSVSRQWYYRDIMAPGSAWVAITGQTNKDLSWDVPQSLQNKVLGLATTIDAGDDGKIPLVGSYPRGGNAEQRKLVGSEFSSVFPVQAYTPGLAAAPNNTALAALFDISSALPSNQNIALISSGDSLTEDYLGITNPLFQAIPAYANRIVSQNRGHGGSTVQHWAPDAAIDAGGTAHLDKAEVPGKNNYTATLEAVVAAKAAGKKVVVSYCIGTNNDGNMNAGAIAAFTATVEGWRAGGADLIVLHGLYTKDPAGIPQLLDILKNFPEFLTSFVSTHDYCRLGQTSGAADYIADLSKTDGVHATDPGLINILQRRYTAANLSAMQSAFPSVAPVTPVITGVKIQRAGQVVTNIAVTNETSIDLDALVEGTNNPSQAVTWSKPSGNGSVDSTGLYQVPAKTNQVQTIVVRATAQGDTHFAEVTITVPALVVVDPDPVSAIDNLTDADIATIVAAIWAAQNRTLTV